MIDKIAIFILRLKYKFIFSKPFIKKGKGRKRVFISYITRPFYDKSAQYITSHQHVLETLAIADALTELGCDVEFHNYDKKPKKIGRFDIIFGIEPNFIDACNVNPDAYKIYYATGAYFTHQNSMIYARTDEFNRKNQTQIPYRRTVGEHNAVEIADAIFQIGTRFTIESYPLEYRNKIQIINQSSHQFENVDLDEKIESYSRKDFVWFGSGGSILKGLDLIFDYFIAHPEYTIHIIGPIESDFLSVYEEKLKTTKNILLHGFMDIGQQPFRTIMQKCCFLLFPSGSEGCPGSVINAMNLGVIPITSKWASIDTIDELGYQLKSFDVDAISEAILWCNHLSDETINSLIRKNREYAITKYNLNNFKEEIKAAFQQVLEKI